MQFPSHPVDNSSRRKSTQVNASPRKWVAKRNASWTQVQNLRWLASPLVSVKQNGRARKKSPPSRVFPFFFFLLSFFFFFVAGYSLVWYILKQLFTDTEMNNCFSIYQNQQIGSDKQIWISSGQNQAGNMITCACVHFVLHWPVDIPQTWVANRSARKTRFTGLLYDNMWYPLVCKTKWTGARVITFPAEFSLDIKTDSFVVFCFCSCCRWLFTGDDSTIAMSAFKQ